MTRQTLAIATLVVFAAPASLGAGGPRVAAAGGETHRYSVSVRVRPLVLFWITRRDVGDAVVTRQWAPGEQAYSLLIGSDPERAPMRVNRWGYISEESRGGRARVVGLMTQSDETSIDEAQASVRKQPPGHQMFKAIDASADGHEAESRVTTFAAPRDFTIRDLDAALAAARERSGRARSRALMLPAGTRTGFLTALVEAMHAPIDQPVVYVYDGRLYELRRTHAADRGDVLAADFLNISRHDGERTTFSMVYGVRGDLADVPLRVVYQPRWWMQIELTLVDGEQR